MCNISQAHTLPCCSHSCLCCLCLPEVLLCVSMVKQRQAIIIRLCCCTSQESKAASKLTDQVLSDVQRSSNDLSKLNSWLQVGCLNSCQDRLLLFCTRECLQSFAASSISQPSNCSCCSCIHCQRGTPQLASATCRASLMWTCRDLKCRLSLKQQERARKRLWLLRVQHSSKSWC